MKRVILFAAINLFLLSQTLQASLAHMPYNLAYAIASMASITADSFDNETDNLPVVQALSEVKHRYTDLARFLEFSRNCDDALPLMAQANYALEFLSQNYRAHLSGHETSLAQMIAFNDRLVAAIE